MKSMKRVLVLVALLALVTSLLTLTCFADTEAADADVTTGEVTEAPADSGEDSASATVTDGGSETKAPTDSTTTAAGDKTDKEESAGDSILWTLIPLGVVLVAIAVCAVIFFGIPKRRVKTLKFLRGLKSEWKKISWYSWKQTWKGTLVVVIVAVVIAIVVGLLDLGFTKGIEALTEFIGPLLK